MFIFLEDTAVVAGVPWFLFSKSPPSLRCGQTSAKPRRTTSFLGKTTCSELSGENNHLVYCFCDFVGAKWLFLGLKQGPKQKGPGSDGLRLLVFLTCGFAARFAAPPNGGRRRDQEKGSEHGSGTIVSSVKSIFIFFYVFFRWTLMLSWSFMYSLEVKDSVLFCALDGWWFNFYLFHLSSCGK